MNNRILYLIGHRGVGKTSLLARLKQYFPERQFFDLDQLIVEKFGLSIEEIFKQKGEEEFRRLENETLNAWQANFPVNQSAVVALGAGFAGEIPSGDGVWVRRPSDGKGRIFSDRPRLNSEIDPLSEYFERLEAREVRYLKQCTRVYLMPEGVEGIYQPEQQFFTATLSGVGGMVTLLPEHFSSERRWQDWSDFYLKSGVRLFELRDDWLSAEQLSQATDKIPVARRLFSYRRENDQAEQHQFISPQMWDWPLELGHLPPENPPILSLHEKVGVESLAAALDRLTEYGEAFSARFLKAAPVVEDFGDLWVGHQWAMAEPERRSFLPRSPSGRWQWYRTWMNHQFAVNFWQDGSLPLSSPRRQYLTDQPTLMQWLAKPAGATSFAAVLGDPVEHSRTPLEQAAFFAERNMPVFAIRILEGEWLVAMHVLEKLGLTHAAVTSPLKHKAFEFCQTRGGEGLEGLSAVNTLLLKNGVWNGANTDKSGVEALLREAQVYSGHRVAIWGGGGTLDVVQEICPKAYAFSARTARLRGGGSISLAPDVVIWSVGRSRMGSCQWPPKVWRPRTVVDLNYSEESPGREYAQMCGGIYIGGLTMFKEQASEQRKFWRQK